MTNLISEWAEFRFPLYTAVQIRSLYGTSSLPAQKIHEEFAVLIGVAGGKAALSIGDQTFELAEGAVLLLPAGAHAALVTDSLGPLHAYKLSIGISEQTLSQYGGSMIRGGELIDGKNVRFFPNEPGIVGMLEELYLYRSPAYEVRHVQNQMVFYRIIFELLSRTGRAPSDLDNGQPSLERSIAYMENHFKDKITREQLAAMAGVSSSHYSILFKRFAGFSPQEYLSRLRVHRAAELLIGGSGTLREIAQKVGYKDEFYLSRRFKRQTGVSPTAYHSVSPQRVAVMLTPYASHLLLLGREPVLTISENGEYVHTAELPQPQAMRFINTDCTFEQLKSALLDTKADMIIAAGQHLHGHGLNPEQLRAIAPVVDIPWMELGWKEHFRLIARAIRQSEKAEAWLAAFEQEEKAARQLVRQYAATGETVAILVLRPDGLLVYGARNVGYVIYHSLGLKPPAKIEQLIKKLGISFHSIPIEPAELADYAGDRLLVIVFPDAKGSTAHADALFQSPDWRELSAVRQNKVHQLDVDEWIPYNPVSIRLQLQRALTLFAGIQ
ncbi:helix-turn-helix domain-containing protein [Paenibacillus macerans]|uniref:AraC family transcriptional regulator n=1 Tax=Paenibacillus macerans TaxID=44252 RepID=UPI002040862B|nr:helix-turn-helix domain-containing protein [Paenibacillus macerans]MCM3701594.1 helix-turn-helix domain-containing protein [Paenibacillus macerans]